MDKTIQIDLKNSISPNWRYVTGIYGTQDIGCSIYPNIKMNADCKLYINSIVMKARK